MQNPIPDPRLQSFHCEDCKADVSASAIIYLRNGFMVIFECACPRSNLVILAPDLKTTQISPQADGAKGLIVMLGSFVGKILVPALVAPPGFNPKGK